MKISAWQIIPGVCLFLGLLSLESRGQSYDYGAYGLFPMASSRSLAMGGASIALGDSASSLVFNPAGIVSEDWSVDLAGTKNRITNKEALKAQGSDYSKPYDFTTYSFVLSSPRFALGFGLSSPYNMKTENNFEATELSIMSGDVALAMRLLKNLRIGISYHQEYLTEKYFVSSPTYNEQTAKDQRSYVRGGFIYEGNKFRVGASYSPQRRFDIDQDERNAAIGVNLFFKDVVIPAKASVGFVAELNEKLLLALDYDRYEKLNNAVYVGSESFSSGNVYIRAEEQFVLHGGLEWALKKSKQTDVILRGGTYREPARLEGASSRNHVTFGIEARFGPGVISVAYDQASDFSNTAQGFSISFGNF